VEYDRLKNLILDAENVDLEGWIICSFTTRPFKQWWSEWSLHLFCASAKIYCHKFDPSSVPNDEVIYPLLSYQFHFRILLDILFYYGSMMLVLLLQRSVIPTGRLTTPLLQRHHTSAASYHFSRMWLKADSLSARQRAPRSLRVRGWPREYSHRLIRLIP
jgi:hypothetical protein